MGYEYMMPRESDKIKSQTTLYRDRYDMLEDAVRQLLQAAQKLKAKSVEPVNTTWYWIQATFG
jgi:TldD protein